MTTLDGIVPKSCASGGGEMDPSTRGLLGHITRWNHHRRPYIRRYPDNCIWRGWLPPMAIAELELAAGRYGYRAEPWTTPQGPMAIPEVRDEPKRFKALIEAWERDPTGYLAELRRRGLVR
jgi:hypothetical protein